MRLAAIQVAKRRRNAATKGSVAWAVLRGRVRADSEVRVSGGFFAGVLFLATCVVGCGNHDKPATQPAGAAGEGPATAASAAAICRRAPVAGVETLRIAVVPMGGTHEFFKAIHAGAVKAERELPGIQVAWHAPLKEGDREAQIKIVENLIGAGVHGIVLAPNDNVALLKPVREAVKAGIGVVVIDGVLNGTACEDFGSNVATDSYVGGQKGARRLGEILGGKGDVILLRCHVGFLSTMRREQGFLDVIAKEFPEIRLVSSDQYGGSTAEEAVKKAESLLGRFPKLDGVFCPNESTTFGMLLALQQSGRAGTVKFVGFDSSDKLIEALRTGQLHGLVVQDPIRMGYTGVKTLAAYLRGEPVPTHVDTGSEVATPETMNEPRIRELLSPPLAKYLP